MRGVALCAVLLALTSSAEDGYSRTRTAQNACLVWPRSEYRYHLWSGLTDQEKNAVERSVATWKSVAAGCNGFTFERLADTDSQSIVDSPLNVIVRRDQVCQQIPEDDDCRLDPLTAHAKCGSLYRCWFLDPSLSAGTLGLTTSSFDPKTGRLRRADIEINQSAVKFDDCVPGTGCDGNYDYENMLTHELGHVVGLGHYEGEQGSTMYPKAPAGEVSKRTVDPGSAAGFCAIYPKGLPPMPCDESAEIKQGLIGLQVVGRSQGCGCSGTWSALPLLAGLWLLRRRS